MTHVVRHLEIEIRAHAKKVAHDLTRTKEIRKSRGQKGHAIVQFDIKGQRS